MQRRAAPRGFTLVEILLALAIVALLATLVLPGINGVLRTMDNQAPDQILWDTVIAARERALTTNHEVWLRFDRENKTLAWNDGTETRSVAWPAAAKLQFLQAKEGGTTVLIGGRLVETQEIPAVRFFPDGTCDRFRAQIQVGSGAARIIAVDPWTCAPMIAAEANK
jgi:general secretion pathway protein H